jgi:hypothetical protein
MEPLKSAAPVKVETPDTFNCCDCKVPRTVAPAPVVSNFLSPKA